VVHDDGLQGITHIVRGDDLFESTHLHRILQELLGLPAPNYHHHALLTDESGHRLAKRDNAITLKSLREAGVSASQLKQELGF
jgi:glutamyl-Q tRNA(Asp) synthetase